MKIIITENQIDKLQVHIQNVIDSELDNIREESEEWGLGEMDEVVKQIESGEREIEDFYLDIVDTVDRKQRYGF